MVNILFFGDLVGHNSVELLCRNLRSLKLKHNADVVVVNGENAFYGKGIDTKIASRLREAGINMVTSGNHIWNHKTRNIVNTYPDFILRPHNYPAGNAGTGIAFIDYKHYKIAVVNLIGRTFMPDAVDNPFESIKKELMTLRIKTKMILVDFHGETTSEKQAIGRLLDGKVSCVVGTHTHVQTADERILPNGTAYISDLGMCGPHNSIIGMKIEAALSRFEKGIPQHYELAEGDNRLNGICVSIDEDSGTAEKIKRISYSEKELGLL
jgi:hypothetical protein